jgi:hypothetical protein
MSDRSTGLWHTPPDVKVCFDLTWLQGAVQVFEAGMCPAHISLVWGNLGGGKGVDQ